MKKICIFDCNTPYVDRNFIFTAVTRARDLKNVIYFHHSDNEVKRLEESRKIQYLKLKINYYKIQDMDAKRDIQRDLFIDVPWFTNAINNIFFIFLFKYKNYSLSLLSCSIKAGILFIISIMALL